MTTEEISVGGHPLTVRRGGSGETLLLLHGANGNMSWLPIFEALAEHYDVIMPDHPGYGDSLLPDGIDSISDVAYFYLDFIEGLGLAGFHLAGHSMGGWIAAEIAVRDSHRLKSLTLVSAAGIRVDGTPMGDLFLWTPEETMRAVFADEALIAERLAHTPSEQELGVMLKNRETTARFCWSPRFHNPDLRKWLHRIRIPTLILWGDSDGIFPEPYAHAYHELIPGSELTVYPHCGHQPMSEAEDAFLERVTTFIDGAGS